MKKANAGLIAGAAVLLGAGTFSYLKRKNDKAEVEGSNLQNKEREDKLTSPDADKDESEKGLTALDHAYKEEWVANTYNPTPEEIKEAERKS